ncbi:MAG: RluA family pseudouridine synthase [Polyangiaceae bacterium]
MARFVLEPEHAGLRLDKVLTRLVPGTSRAEAQRWIDAGRVQVDGQAGVAKRPVATGQVIEAEPLPPAANNATPDATVELVVLYEDDALIVIDKPAGMVVHPARGHWSGTLVNGLLARPGFSAAAADPADGSGALRPGIVQRLDKDTSGVLVVAKSVEAREGLKAQLGAREVRREYLAITCGRCEPGRIETLHGRHPRSRLRFSSRVERGRPAITNVQVEEVLAGGIATRVRCRLETGRTHQIRVHLAEQRDAPLLADVLYGRSLVDERLRAAAQAIGRQALHASLLGFVHPLTGAEMRFEAPVPEDFRRALELLSR